MYQRELQFQTVEYLPLLGVKFAEAAIFHYAAGGAAIR